MRRYPISLVIIGIALIGGLIMSEISAGSSKDVPSHTKSVESNILGREKLALVYQGPGSCEAEKNSTGCTEAAAQIAKQAGFQVEIVGPSGAKDPSVWSRASVWIQPGGRARKQAQAMTPDLLAKIRDFVKSGGGYVGFCAGAFMAGQKFGWDDEQKPGTRFEATGIGLMEGFVQYFGEWDDELTEATLARILSVKWNGKNRDVYWELGPYFDKSTLDTQKYEILAYYHDEKGNPRMDHGMTLRGDFGRGRFFVTAVHPEAPQDWRDWYKINDADGTDEDLAVDMVKWVTRSSP